MPWILPSHAVETYKRNTLVAVVAQLRFEPILKISAKIPNYQDRVRSRFSGFEEVETTTFAIDGASAKMRTSRESAFRFSVRNEPVLATLTKDALTLEYQKHHERAVLASDAALLLLALREEYAPLLPVRFGLRYVNIVDATAIGGQLGREVQWTDLVAPQFSGVPGGLADHAGTSFISEVTSTLPLGKMTLRYGMRREQPTGRVCFRLDTDRYLENTFDLRDLGGMLETFSSEIFQVFKAAAGPALLEWMTSNGEPT